jgi:hypothetical protein
MTQQGADRSHPSQDGDPQPRPFAEDEAATAAQTESEAETELSRAWSTLEQRLAAALESLSGNEFLILVRPGTEHFVQFAAHDGEGLRAEAVSGYYTEEPAEVLDARHERLLALGWRAPTNFPDHLSGHEPEGSPNYFLDLAEPVRFPALAATVVRTLREAYAVSTPEALAYEAFRHQSPMTLPGLGIAAERDLEGAEGDAEATEVPRRFKGGDDVTFEIPWASPTRRVEPN